MNPMIRPGMLMHAALLAGFSFCADACGQSFERVSLSSSGSELPGGGYWSTISGNGRYVAFVSSDSVVPGDTNGYADVFRKDLATGLVELVSVTATGVQANDHSHEPHMSDDGRFVVFSAWASNLAATDVNGNDTDIFVKDMATGALRHVSVSSSGAGGNAISASHDLSGDGRFVTFLSYSDNLVANDTNGNPDTFLFDLTSSTIECLSVDSNGLPGGGGEASISDDGRMVSFQSWSALSQIATLVLDRQTGVATPLAIAFGLPINAISGTMSGDGRTVAFTTLWALSPTDTDIADDTYTYEVATGNISHISTSTLGPDPFGGCTAGAVSDDGRFVAFRTLGSYLPSDTNGKRDSYLVDTVTGSFELATTGTADVLGNASSVINAISDNGQLLCIFSLADNLVPGDTNGNPDTFLRDRCVSASWANYGAGLAGTNGLVPGFSMVGEPVVGTTPLLAIANNTGALTVGWLAFGSVQASLPTPLFGTLLLVPQAAVLVTIPTPAVTMPLPIPSSIDLCGDRFYLQTLVLDAGAPSDVAFTRGIELTVGG